MGRQSTVAPLLGTDVSSTNYHIYGKKNWSRKALCFFLASVTIITSTNHSLSLSLFMFVCLVFVPSIYIYDSCSEFLPCSVGFPGSLEPTPSNNLCQVQSSI